MSKQPQPSSPQPKGGVMKWVFALAFMAMCFTYFGMQVRVMQQDKCVKIMRDTQQCKRTIIIEI